jgi:putative ABC transport system permease protein
MRALLEWLSLRHWLRHPVRAGLTLFGVALGVAVTISVDLISGEILHAHRRTLEAIAGKAELTVTAGESGMDRAAVDAVRGVPGVKWAEPLLEMMLVEPDKGPVMLLGVDFLEESPMRQLEAHKGDEDVLDDPISFLNSTTSVVVAERFAARRNLKKDDRFELATSKGNKPFVIRGLLRDTGPAKAFAGDVVVMYLDAAQIALEMGEKISRIDVDVKEGAELPKVREAIAAALGPGFTVDYPMRRGARLEEMMVGLRQALLVMALLAIWVGVLLAYNAVEISVRQRKGELAILRAIGATRGSVVAMVLVEAVVLGLVATGLGVFLGRVLAANGIASTANAVSQAYDIVRVEEVQLTGGNFAVAVFVGFLIPVLGALRPALWVANEPPAIGLGRPIEDSGAVPSERRDFLVGLLVLGSGLALLGSQWASEVATVGYAAFGLVMLGAVFFAPALISLTAGMVHRRGARFLSAETIVALDHVVRDRRRAALNVASLVAGVATVTTVGTYMHSLSVTNEQWLDSAVPADLFVTSGSKLATTANIPLDPTLGEAFLAMDGVESVFRVRLADVDHRKRPVKLVSIELSFYKRYASAMILRGQKHHPGLGAGTHVLVSENLARREHYEPEGTITLDTPKGPRDFKVAAVVVDFTSDVGTIVIDRSQYVDLWGDAAVDSFDLFMKPGVDPTGVQARIRKELGAKYSLFVLTNAEFRAEASGLLDSFFQLLDLLQLVTLAIAVLGVSTTLMASVLDRTQEVGLMRAVGSTPRQVVRIVLSEAAFLGAAAAICGMLLGSATGALFLRSILVATAGWSLPYYFPAHVYPQVAIGVVLSSVLAALYPALWSARQPTLDALRAD